ncbi:MAG: NAD(P)-binding protein, partial [Actinomycetota bacterium]|nr:NAD(P)-binding protein [Actinomycetota bacterium]
MPGSSTPDFSGDLASSDDDTIRAALAVAEVPALLPAVAAALGDLDLLPEHLRPNLSVMMDPNAGLSADQQAEARALAFDAVVRLRAQAAAGPLTAPAPSVDELRTLLTYVSGGAPVDDYLELLREELALGEDLRAPTWRKDDIAPERSYRVVIIGAGMSGLVAAYRLRQAGLD